MIQVTPKVFLATVAEFGDAAVLAANNIELALLFHPLRTFPHTAIIQQATFYVQDDGATQGWYIKGLAKLLADVYGLKVMALSDRNGGMRVAAFILCCAYAQKQTTSFNTGKTWLENIVGALNVQIPPALVAQGQGLYP